MKIQRTLLVLLPILLVACSSSSDSGKTSGAGGSDGSGGSGAGGGNGTGGDAMYPGCPRDEVESDLTVANPMTGMMYPQSAKNTTWMGGAALDPKTHQLSLAKGSYLVSSTRLALKPGKAVYGHFMELSNPVVGEAFANPGALAITFALSKKCNSARTLIIWKDMQSMMALVSSKAHTAAASQDETVSRGGSTVTHWQESDPSTINWGQAATEIGKAEPLD